jgi:quaternary ammonium compound-resistance protein SugE
MVKALAAAGYARLPLRRCSIWARFYYQKKADRFSRLWPSSAALILIGLTQWLLSRPIASAMDMGLPIASLVVSVMIGSALMGMLLFGEPLSAQKITGFGIVIFGVLISSLAKASSAFQIESRT